MINIIVAADENNTIGKDNDLIWRLPDDLKFFKQKTSVHPIIMGRKTYESVGRPLPNRTNIIITRDQDYTVDGCVVVNSLDEAFSIANDDEIFVVGGAEIYRQALPVTDRVYLTRVHHTFDGDRFFPELGDEWQEIESVLHPIDEKHVHAFTFKTYIKR
jgi:dihydrofolate reductase